MPLTHDPLALRSPMYTAHNWQDALVAAHQFARLTGRRYRITTQPYLWAKGFFWLVRPVEDAVQEPPC